SGSGTTNIDGTFYAPAANMKITGSSGTANIGSQYIALQLTLSGNGTVNVNYATGTQANERMIYLATGTQANERPNGTVNVNYATGTKDNERVIYLATVTKANEDNSALVGGLLHVGDRVGVRLVVPAQPEKRQAASSSTLLKDVEVIAVNGRV